jgi:outer membrane protein OmpA-like peptidoglycan-associated protein
VLASARPAAPDFAELRRRRAAPSHRLPPATMQSMKRTCGAFSSFGALGAIAALGAAALLALAGCAALRPAAPAGSVSAAPAPTAQQRAQIPEALAIERHWLLSYFRGTPVAIGQRSDGSLAIGVPQRYCFDAGKAQVKPPLAAVLDKVAESLHRRPFAVLLQIAAPGSRDGALAIARANAVRDALSARGIAPSRLAAPTASGADSVKLLIGVTPG